MKTQIVHGEESNMFTDDDLKSFQTWGDITGFWLLDRTFWYLRLLKGGKCVIIQATVARAWTTASGALCTDLVHMKDGRRYFDHRVPLSHLFKTEEEVMPIVPTNAKLISRETYFTVTKPERLMPYDANESSALQEIDI